MCNMGMPGGSGTFKKFEGLSLGLDNKLKIDRTYEISHLGNVNFKEINLKEESISFQSTLPFEKGEIIEFVFGDYEFYVMENI